MSVVPNTRPELIQFCEDRANVWSGSGIPAQIGLTAAQVSELEALAATARTVYSAATAARAASKAATTTYHNATDMLHEKVANMVKEIRTYAETTNNQQVYALAQIPAPAPPSPIPAPGQPDQFSARILSNGAVTLTFRATTPRGGGSTVYLVKRRLPSLGETAFTLIGTVGTEPGGRRGIKEYTDSTLPLGANPAEYIVQGQRGSSFGPMSNVFTLTLGAGPGVQAEAGSAAGGGAGGGGGGDLKMAA